MRAMTSALVGLAVGSAAYADVVDIPSARDNTMYQSTTGALSNGAGPGMHAGANGFGALRRALVLFNVAAAVPAGSTINSATLKLTCEQSISLNTTVRLHRVLADWGEAGSIGLGVGGGQGGPAQAGDATWLHRFYPGVFWAAPGGEFAGAPTASAVVSGPDTYVWGPTSEMTADVQGWLDTPAGNFGWVVIGDESAVSTAKRFDTREGLTPSTRPVLAIDFTPPCYADCNTDGSLTVADFGCFQTRFVQGNLYADCNGNGTLTVADFGCFQTEFVQGCP